MIPRRKPRIYKGETKDILKLLFSKKVREGKYIKEFEKEFANYIGTKYAIAVSSGRKGMELILESLKLKEGDEVIIPAYTLKDLIYIIQSKGLKVRLVDIDINSFNMNPDLIEPKITQKTRIIIATHLFGLPCQMEKILNIARKYDIYIIEDCTHSLGAEYKGKKTGTFGIAGFFSLEAIKPINTFGGGIITTNNSEIANFIRKKIKDYTFDEKKLFSKIFYVYLENLLIRTQLFSLINLLFISEFTKRILSKVYLSFHSKVRARNTKFTNLQAFLGIKQLKDLDEKNQMRKKIALKLTKKLEKLKPSLIPQKFEEGRIFYFYVVRVLKNNVEDLRRKLLLSGIDAGIKEEITDNCSLIGNIKDTCPFTDKVFNSAVQLPIYDDLKDKDLNRIVSTLEKIIG